MYEAEKREAGTVSVLPARNSLECFEIHEDPRRRVHVSCAPKAPSPTARVRERAVSLFDVMDKVGYVISFLASMGMLYLLIRMSYGVLLI